MEWGGGRAIYRPGEKYVADQLKCRPQDILLFSFYLYIPLFFLCFVVVVVVVVLKSEKCPNNTPEERRWKHTSEKLTRIMFFFALHQIAFSSRIRDTVTSSLCAANPYFPRNIDDIACHVTRNATR